MINLIGSKTLLLLLNLRDKTIIQKEPFYRMQAVYFMLRKEGRTTSAQVQHNIWFEI